MRYRLFAFLFLFLLFCFVVPCCQAFTLVQQNSASTGNTTNSVTFSGANTAGNLIIVVADWINGGNVTSISDSKGNTYLTAVGPTANSYTSQIWYAANIAAAAANTNTITINFSVWNNSTIDVFEYSGLAVSSPLDVTNSNSGSSNSLSTGSVTTTQPNELVFATGSAVGPLTGDSAYTLEANNNWQGLYLAVEDKAVTGTGTYSATFSSTANYLWVAQIATFKAAVAPPTITTQPVNQTVTAGQTATFSVVASGTAPLSYQWQKNSANISGATSSTYTTPATTTSDSGSTFDVVVTNSGGSVTSNVATLTVVTAGTPTCGIANDTTNFIPGSSNDPNSNWATPPVPTKGGSYTDPKFGCTVTRITDVSTEEWEPSCNGSGCFMPISHSYATVSPFNANDTFLMLADGWNRHFVTDLTGNIIVPISTDGTAMPDCGNSQSCNITNSSNDTYFLWDATNPNVFYYTFQNYMMRGTISGSSLSTSQVHQFTEYAAINFMGDSDVSQDGQHVAIVGGDNTGNSAENAFVYNFVSNTKGNVYTTKSCTGVVDNTNNSCLHRLLLTPDNNLIIDFDCQPGTNSTCDPNPCPGTNTTGEVGYRLWNGTALSGIQNCTDHIDTGKDLNGKSVFIGVQNSTTFPGSTNPCTNQWTLDVMQVDLSSGACLFTTFIPQYHVSYRGNSSQPWAALSMFDTTGCPPNSNSPEYFNGTTTLTCNSTNYTVNYASPTASTCGSNGASSCWYPFEDEIMAIKIDGSSFYRLARAYSRSDEDYAANPKASISRDGKYIAFDSNMAFAQSGCPSNFKPNPAPAATTYCSDVYVIKVQ